MFRFFRFPFLEAYPPRPIYFFPCFSFCFFEAHPRSTTVLVNELETRGFQKAPSSLGSQPLGQKLPLPHGLRENQLQTEVCIGIYIVSMTERGKRHDCRILQMGQ
jgi:hypothetical protein